VHTSTEACLSSVAIQIWICIQIPDPDCHQNLIICSLAHSQPSLKISCKSVQKFLCKVANRQINKQRRLHILLGGGNYAYNIPSIISPLKNLKFLCWLGNRNGIRPVKNLANYQESSLSEKSRGQPANPGSPGKRLLKQHTCTQLHVSWNQQALNVQCMKIKLLYERSSNTL